MPLDSDIVLTKDPFFRKIVIKNGLGSINIEINSRGSHVAQQGVWGVLKQDPNNTNRYHTMDYLVKLSMRVSRFRRYSQEIIDYRNWFSNISKVLSIYDWGKVENEIQRTEERRIITDLLEK